jgi:hypothetical protein
MSDPEPNQKGTEEELIQFLEKARNGKFVRIREVDLLYVRQKEIQGYNGFDDDNYIYGIS